jgi:hypothetical protein
MRVLRNAHSRLHERYLFGVVGVLGGRSLYAEHDAGVRDRHADVRRQLPVDPLRRADVRWRELAGLRQLRDADANLRQRNVVGLVGL